MITADLAHGLVGWEREADFEARGDTACAAQADEQGMEVGAVSSLRIAGVLDVAAPPASATLVVFQSRDGVIVNGFDLIEPGRPSPSDFQSQIADLAVDWHEPVSLERAIRSK